MTTVVIDFGTSNTVVCTTDLITQTPRTLKFDLISRRFEVGGEQVSVVPSLVFVEGENRLLFGEQVRAKRLGFVQPERYFRAFKRELAADFVPPPRLLDGNNYSAEAVSELFLRNIWQMVEEQLQPSHAIFTVPVGAFERYLDWFRAFADKLSIPKVQIVDESTAAALGYAVQRPGSVVLVVDFGGGTLDLSLVRTVSVTSEHQVVRAEVLAKSDAFVGGVDIDTWIVEHYLKQIASSRTEVGEIGWQNLLEVAEKLKIRLSTADEAKEAWFDDENFMSHELQLNRDELAEILEAEQLLEVLRQALDEVLAIALTKGINKSSIEQVLLVGGTCQIPAVQQLVTSYFGRQKVKLDKPFEAVAHGALALSKMVTVDDYLRHSYAIRLWEPHSKTYSYLTLIEKGMRYPGARSQPLTLQVATQGQREIRLDIGEVAEVSQAEVIYDASGRMTSMHLVKQDTYRSLENHHQQVCVAHLDPPGETGVDRIEVQFEVNEQRVLVVTVKDLLTKNILVERGAIAKLQ
ncbi:Hsp70 family protein [Scytonema sp. UIC 10036]|uniref:Hsp70 family protein n=1 Tax=Scytonema sp. UIC 10036 TaxID=2304196 RepID=UPI0012DA1E31|nr:Hsp70 family protein [Scytonema sp. UIC 10036]MUH01400.1 Hsp70 family protein [Scytonema sp. UIC 10036]